MTLALEYTPDFTTDNMVVKATQRYSVSWQDWRTAAASASNFVDPFISNQRKFGHDWYFEYLIQHKAALAERE